MGLCFKIYQDGKLCAAADTLDEGAFLLNYGEKNRTVKYRGGVIWNRKVHGIASPYDLLKAVRVADEKKTEYFKKLHGEKK